ncbi:MAG: methionyl-tRNA formyltransferase [Acidobacteriota bacterium]
MRVVFMGTPEFAVASLERLLQDRHEVVAVFTQPDRPAGRGQRLTASPVKQLALTLGLPVFQPERVGRGTSLDTLKELGPDLTIVAAFGQILPQALLEVPRYGSINVHASLLPRYRGAAPIQRAIWNGDRQTGISIMQMDAGLDTGAVWVQRSIEIGPDEAFGELQQRLAAVGADLLAETLSELVSGHKAPVPQANEQATLAPRIRKDEGHVDWSRPAASVHNQIRALNPWPAAFSWLRAARTTIWRSGISAAAKRDLQPGTIADLSENSIGVVCGDNSLLRVFELQWPGRRRLPAPDFARGLALEPGESFEAQSPVASRQSPDERGNT